MHYAYCTLQHTRTKRYTRYPSQTKPKRAPSARWLQSKQIVENQVMNFDRAPHELVTYITKAQQFDRQVLYRHVRQLADLVRAPVHVRTEVLPHDYHFFPVHLVSNLDTILEKIKAQAH